MTSPASPISLAPLRDAIGQELLWQKTKMFKRNYELRLGAVIFATLVWQRSWRSAADLTTFEGRWTIQRKGVWRPKIIVTDVASGAEVAVYARKWTGGGTITFDPEHVYSFKRRGVFNAEWQWLTPQEAPVMRLKARGFGGSARVIVGPTGVGATEASILAALGWYLLIQMADEAATTAATTAVATTT